MHYAELEIRTTSMAAEAVAEVLMNQGATGIATENPEDIRALLQQPDALIYYDEAFTAALPDFVTVKAYFPAEVLEEGEAFRKRIETALLPVAEHLPLGEGWHALRKTEERDWVNEWKRFYRPLRISRRLVVCPTWTDCAHDPDDLIIRLDPGQAFGTGRHASTALVLERMDAVFHPAVRRVLDVGTGSGILSIAAALLGAEQVDALDIDPVAVRVAAENAAANGLSGRISCRQGALQDALTAYDLIVMNIVAEVVSAEAGRVGAYLQPDGLFICSGIVDYKAAAVRACLLQAEWLIIEEAQREEWSAFVCKKKPAPAAAEAGGVADY